MSRGIRRDGLWAKAIALSNGSESLARTKYISLLVEALRDEVYIAQRAGETANTPSEMAVPSPSPQAAYISHESPAVVRPMGALKRSLFMTLFVLALAMIVIALPLQLYTEGVKPMQFPVLLIWLAVGFYAYTKLFANRSLAQASQLAEAPKRSWGIWDTIGLFFFAAWLIWLFVRSQ